MDQTEENRRAAWMLNCSDGWLNRRLLPIKPLSFTEGRAEVEGWGWEEEERKVPKQHRTVQGWQVCPHLVRVH